MKKLFALQSLSMLAMLSSSNIQFIKNENPTKFRKPKNIEPNIPKLLKEYWFDCFGNFYNEAPFQYSFKCYALNDKNAIRKFNNFMNSNSVPVA